MQLYIITKCESIVTGSSAVTTAADYNHHILTKTDHTKCNNSCVEMPSQTLIYNELLLSITFAGRVGFEKLTELDYRGTTYYTIRNLSLYECQGWCREEPDCAAASFRFVVFSGWHSRKWQTITQNKATSHRDEVYSSTHLFFFLYAVLWSTRWRPSRRRCVCCKTRRPGPVPQSARKSPSPLITWSSSTSDQVITD